MNTSSAQIKTPSTELLPPATAPSYAEAMIRTVNISNAKANLSKLADEVASGDQVIVSKAGKPVMKLVPLTPQEAAAFKPKTLNGLLGKYAEEFKDFDWEEWDRLDDEVHKLWRKFGYMD
jgi:prevent-host-death family protein